MSQGKPDPVLRDPRRRKVNRLLGRAGPGLQQLHRDGCRVVDGELPLEAAVNALGNCAREIESAVRGLFVDLVVEHAAEPPCDERCARCEKEIRHVGETHRQQIEQVLAALKLTDPEIARTWFELTDFASITHRRGLEHARPLGPEHRETWRQLEDLLALLLPYLEERLLVMLPRYRTLAELAQPSKADLTRFRRLPNTYRTRREFIDNATPGWFKVLDKGRFFDQPEDAFTWDAQEGTPVPQHWPAVDYLVRMATLPEHQERFVSIFERLDFPHEWAVNDLVKAASSLPPALASRCAVALRRWIDQQTYIFLAARTIAEFAASLGAQGEAASGGDLLRVLLALGPEPPPATALSAEEAALHTPEPTSRLRDHEYEVAVTRGLIALADGDAAAAIAVSRELLDQALRYSEEPERVASRRDSSTWWRQSLVDDRGRYSHEFANQLTNAVLASSRALLRSGDLAIIAELVARLENEQWTLFRRIALQLLAERPDHALIRARLLDGELIDVGGAWPEFRTLLARHFTDLTPDEQRRYVELVEGYQGDGADPDFTGSIERRDWVLRRLRPVAEHLAQDITDRYPELRGARREGTSDDIEVGVVTGWVGNRPQLSAEQLGAMSDAEIVTHLRTWQPSGRFDGPHIEGQGDALRAAVVAEPARFSAAAMSFVGLDYTYVRAVIGGAYDALRANGTAPIDWGPLLDLASWVIAQPAEEPRSSFSRDPDWRWTHKTIADLVHHGLGEIASSIPLAKADQVWALIAWLAENDGDATEPRTTDTQDEAREEQDALSAALNSTRGEAIQAAISFVAWRWRTSGGVGPAVSSDPRAASLLLRHLDHTQDRSLATRGAFGVRLPQLIGLDADWVRDNLTQFFPPEAPLVRALTWQAYVLWNWAYTGVRALLTDEYRAAIGRLRVRARSRLDVGEKLAEHLMAYYLSGDINLTSADGLLAAFYERAPAEVRGQATAYVGQVLRDSADQTEPEHCARVQRLWTWRREAMATRPPEERRAELENFGWWFASEPCDQDWLLEELIRTLELTGSIENDSLVMEKLVLLAPAKPDAVLHAVELMIEAPKERWMVQVWIDEIVAIIRATLGSSSDARGRRLGARLVADNFDNGLIALLRPTT